MGTMIASATSCGLLQIPPETRYRIYDLAFQDSKFAFSDGCDKKVNESMSNLVVLRSTGFPIRLTEVCHLLHDEVADYMAYHLNSKLRVDTDDRQFAMQHFIPGRYRARVWHLDTTYAVMEHNMLFNIEFLPRLHSLSVHLGTTLVKSELDEFDNIFAFHGPSTKIAKYQDVNRYFANCFSDFDGCKTLIRYCREFSIDSVICFRACFAFKGWIQEIQDIELHNACGQEQELRVTTKKLPSLQEVDDLKVGRVFAQDDSSSLIPSDSVRAASADNVGALISSPASAVPQELLQRPSSYFSATFANSLTSLKSKDGSASPSALLDSDRVSQLPQELRIRVYDFLFFNPRFHVYNTEEGILKLRTYDFPLAITATCHLFHDELEDYVATLADIKLINGAQEHDFGLAPLHIPERYCARGTRLKTTIKVLRRDLQIISLLQTLRQLNMHLGTINFDMGHDSAQAYGVFIDTKEFKDNRVANYTSKRFEGHEGACTIFHVLLNRNIHTKIRYRTCFVMDYDTVEAVQDVDIRLECNGEQSLPVVGKSFERDRPVNGKAVHGQHWDVNLYFRREYDDLIISLHGNRALLGEILSS